MPWISWTLVTFLVPSGWRSSCTMTLIALAICSLIARTGNSKPAISTMVSKRDSASRGEFACTVVSEPS